MHKYILMWLCNIKNVPLSRKHKKTRINTLDLDKNQLSSENKSIYAEFRLNILET